MVIILTKIYFFIIPNIPVHNGGLVLSYKYNFFKRGGKVVG